MVSLFKINTGVERCGGRHKEMHVAMVTQPLFRLSLPLSPITVKSVQNSFILLDAYDTIIVLQPQLGETGA